MCVLSNLLSPKRHHFDLILDTFTNYCQFSWPDPPWILDSVLKVYLWLNVNHRIIGAILRFTIIKTCFKPPWKHKKSCIYHIENAVKYALDHNLSDHLPRFMMTLLLHCTPKRSWAPPIIKPNVRPIIIINKASAIQHCIQKS